MKFCSSSSSAIMGCSSYSDKHYADRCYFRNNDNHSHGIIYVASGPPIAWSLSGHYDDHLT